MFIFCGSWKMCGFGLFGCGFGVMDLIFIDLNFRCNKGFGILLFLLNLVVIFNGLGKVRFYS